MLIVVERERGAVLFDLLPTLTGPGIVWLGRHQVLTALPVVHSLSTF